MQCKAAAIANFTTEPKVEALSIALQATLQAALPSGTSATDTAILRAIDQCDAFLNARRTGAANLSSLKATVAAVLAQAGRTRKLASGAQRAVGWASPKPQSSVDDGAVLRTPKSSSNACSSS